MTLEREREQRERRAGSGDRRDFLKAGVRAVALGALALTGTVLGLRTAARGTAAGACALELPCRRCRLLRDCSEPRAVRVKEESGARLRARAPDTGGGARG